MSDITEGPLFRSDRDALDSAVGAVVFNAANHPNPSAVWGRDVSLLRQTIVDAVLVAGFARPVPGNTRAELVAELQVFADLYGPHQEGLTVRKAIAALSAAEAELSRRDTAEHAATYDGKYRCSACGRKMTTRLDTWVHVEEGALAAAPVSLEAVKAETDREGWSTADRQSARDEAQRRFGEWLNSADLGTRRYGDGAISGFTLGAEWWKAQGGKAETTTEGDTK